MQVEYAGVIPGPVPDDGIGIIQSKECSLPREENRKLAIPHGEGCSSGFGEHSWALLESAHEPKSLRSGRHILEMGEMGKGEAAGPSFSGKDFPPIGLGRDPTLPLNNSSTRKKHSVRADDFILEGMYRIAKQE
jgi:hypothetical protein